MPNCLFKKGLVIGIITLLITIVVSPASGNVIFKKTNIEEQNITDNQEIPLINSDDIEIYIYAGNKSDNPSGPSYGLGAYIKVINHLNEAIWIYFQEDYFSLLSGKPIDAFQFKNQFVSPPHETTTIRLMGGVPIPCRYRITVQAHIFEYISRSGFQFRYFTFFPGEK